MIVSRSGDKIFDDQATRVIAMRSREIQQAKIHSQLDGSSGNYYSTAFNCNLPNPNRVLQLQLPNKAKTHSIGNPRICFRPPSKMTVLRSLSRKAVNVAPTVTVLPSGVPHAPRLNLAAAGAPSDHHHHDSHGQRSDLPPSWASTTRLASGSLVSTTRVNSKTPAPGQSKTIHPAYATLSSCSHGPRISLHAHIPHTRFGCWPVRPRLLSLSCQERQHQPGPFLLYDWLFRPFGCYCCEIDHHQFPLLHERLRRRSRSRKG